MSNWPDVWQYVYEASAASCFGAAFGNRKTRHGQILLLCIITAAFVLNSDAGFDLSGIACFILRTAIFRFFLLLSKKKPPTSALRNRDSAFFILSSLPLRALIWAFFSIYFLFSSLEMADWLGFSMIIFSFYIPEVQFPISWHIEEDGMKERAVFKLPLHRVTHNENSYKRIFKELF